MRRRSRGVEADPRQDVPGHLQGVQRAGQGGAAGPGRQDARHRRLPAGPDGRGGGGGEARVLLLLLFFLLLPPPLLVAAVFESVAVAATAAAAAAAATAAAAAALRLRLLLPEPDLLEHTNKEFVHVVLDAGRRLDEFGVKRLGQLLSL